MQKVQEEIHNVNYENILIHLVASNMFVLISMFTKNWGRNWGIFDPNDFLKLFLNKMDFSNESFFVASVIVIPFVTALLVRDIVNELGFIQHGIDPFCMTKNGQL